MIKTIKTTLILIVFLLLLNPISPIKYQKIANGAGKIARSAGKGSASPHFYRMIRQLMIYLWGRELF
jgi:hypothetical protein